MGETRREGQWHLKNGDGKQPFVDDSQHIKMNGQSTCSTRGNRVSQLVHAAGGLQILPNYVQETNQGLLFNFLRTHGSPTKVVASPQ